MQTYGNADKALSPYLKAWIKPEGKDILVCGAIGQGTSRQLQANWNSPFEQSNVGGAFDKVGNAAQTVGPTAGMTSVSKMNSEQVWDGNRPPVYNLVLEFYALADALEEVVRPCALLDEWASPEVNALLPGGRIPTLVTLNIGRTSIVTNCVIESTNFPLDKEKTRDGLLIRAQANLQISTKAMLNASEILPSWGIGSATIF